MSARQPLLQFNPAPIKVVPAESRDVWFRQQGFRCEHEDGRGRCTSRDTHGYWNNEERSAEHFCAKHLPATNSGRASADSARPDSTGDFATVREGLKKGGWEHHDFKGADIDTYHVTDECRICLALVALDRIEAANSQSRVEP